MVTRSALDALTAKIIILRHGEKSTSTGPSGKHGLCSVDWNRSVALNTKYLSRAWTGAAIMIALLSDGFMARSPGGLATPLKDRKEPYSFDSDLSRIELNPNFWPMISARP